MKVHLLVLLGISNFFFIQLQPNDTVQDIDGNVYPTIVIGEQKWMVENLRTTRFNDGEPISILTDNTDWHEENSAALSWYENVEERFKDTYGALYNGLAVKTGKLCPENWHVPTKEDWLELASYLQGRDIPGTKILMEGELKSKRTDPESHPRWDLPNKGATDDSNFSGLPGGLRNYLGVFNYLGKFGFWWSSSDDDELGYYIGLRYDDPDLFLVSGNKKNGFSVRCIQS